MENATIDETANVPVKSAWLSKINWTAIGSAAVSLVTSNALGLEPQTQATILLATNLVTNVATMIFRTYFNQTVTPS
jgi:hypothetical protein